MSRSIQLYHTLPFFLKQLVCTYEGNKIHKRRFDKTFFQFLQDYNERLVSTNNELLKYRDNCLIKFIHHAIDNVPYYKQFKKSEFNTINDITKLPVLTKETVRTNSRQFIPQKYKHSDSITSHTSGTTGAGLIFPVSKMAEKHQWAVWWRYRNNLGIKFKTKCGLFTGQPIIAPVQLDPPFWMFNKSNNEIIFSGYHLNAKNIYHYIEAINKYKIEWLHGYPSNLAMLAKLIAESSQQINHKIKYITAGAESLLTHQKNMIELVFKTKIYSHYGLAEGVANISECINGIFHIDEDFSMVELIPISGNKYNIVGTNFHNYDFPLLRYDTGDIAIIDDTNQACTCKHQGRIISSIDGRKEEYIYLSDGSAVGRLDHLFKDLVHVKQAQIFQKEIGIIEIRIVKDVHFSESDEKKLIEEINIRMGDKIKYNIKYLNEIKKTNTGKFRFILSDIKKNTLEIVEN